MSDDKAAVKIPIYTYHPLVPSGTECVVSVGPSRATWIARGGDAWNDVYKNVETQMREAATMKGFNAIIGAGYSESPILDQNSDVIGYNLVMYGHFAKFTPPIQHYPRIDVGSTKSTQ